MVHHVGYAVQGPSGPGRRRRIPHKSRRYGTSQPAGHHRHDRPQGADPAGDGDDGRNPALETVGRRRRGDVRRGSGTSAIDE